MLAARAEELGDEATLESLSGEFEPERESLVLLDRIKHFFSLGS